MAFQEERKVVSVLFCDLVGFTAASDAADPEDVQARIRPYHARLRREVERFGGTVEKFIGDAVMAVFGAPVAHEDDAERAVRAGLRILEAIGELNAESPALSLRVRVGINTGEAVVALGARPEEGEGIVAGDVVNTASRLQGAAPVDGIACSEQTYRQTERVFEFERLEPVVVKGKAAPLVMFRPLLARSRVGSDVVRGYSTPLVGRELEKPLLIGTFERSAQQRSCQLVMIVGEPGVGKSRLCAELFGHAEERAGLVRWRQGRCLPYGDGIAFWALGEIVKAECGILESDSPQQAAAKLEHALPAEDVDVAWLGARLRPLVGAGGVPAGQQESFTAWRRFLESLAVGRETVLVFEDLHWADPALLSFLEYLADWAQGVPLLLLCTARPELYEQHPTFGANARNAQRINLAPLTDAETARLVAALLQRAVLPAQTQRVLLERAGGNPLYAEEFVALLTDRGELGGVEAPESVQALIAARLDTLVPERKSLLQDAAVVGKVFWAGALVEMGGRDPGEVEVALHELTRMELVRPARNSSMHGEAEYGFWHGLVADVCYGQIPRAGRVARHRAAAAWIQDRAGERVEDLADVLAHHYLSALELTRAAGQQAQGELEEGAIRYLALAGERALALDVDRAEASLAKALALAPAGHPERASLLERWAKTAQQQNRPQEARAALEEALGVHREGAQPLAQARVLTAVADVLTDLGDPRWEAALTEALALLEAQPPGLEHVAAHTELAGGLWLGGAHADAIVAAERALRLAAELGLPEPALARSVLGAARADLGEREGLAQLRRALELALEQGQAFVAARTHNNLAFRIWRYEGPRAALAACQDGVEFCQRRGITQLALWIAAGIPALRAELGETEQALADAESVAERLQAAGDVNPLEPRGVQLRLLAERGDHQQAPSWALLVARARESGELWSYAQVFAAAARLLLAQQRPQEAQALLVELEQVPQIRAEPSYAANLPELVRTALGAGQPELAADLAAGVAAQMPVLEHALTTATAQLAEAAGEHSAAAASYALAAERWRQFGNVPERAYALLGQGRCLTALDQRTAAQPLRLARDLFASMGYQPALAETEALLADSRTATM